MWFLNQIKQYKDRKRNRDHDQKISKSVNVKAKDSILSGQPFTFYKNEQTQPPIVVPYLLYGRGTFRNTAGSAIHSYRIRRYMGSFYDPVQVHGGLQIRKWLLSQVCEEEKREVYLQVWQTLLSDLPSHTVHFSYSLIKGTGSVHNILYLPLCFRFQGHSPDYLARRWAEFHCHIAEKVSEEVLLPNRTNTGEVQKFWLVINLRFLEYLLFEEPLERFG